MRARPIASLLLIASAIAFVLLVQSGAISLGLHVVEAEAHSGAER